MAILANMARMSTATTGTGTITLGSAVAGFLSFATAGITDGQEVSYAIEDGTNREVGRGIYTTSGTTLTRSVLKSTNAGAAISLSGAAEVFITALAEDITKSFITLGTQATTSGTSKTFTSIPLIYADLHIEIKGVSHNSGTIQTLSMAFSTDGVTFSTPVLATDFTAAVDVWNGVILIFGYSGDVSAMQFWLGMGAALGTNNVFTGSPQFAGFHTGGITAVRLSLSGGSFDAGSIVVKAR